MKIQHAIVKVEQLVQKQTPFLEPEEVVAITVLLRLAKRVTAVKKALSSLARAVSGDDELNQESLPGTEE